jgi:hypothetical protein
MACTGALAHETVLDTVLSLSFELRIFFFRPRALSAAALSPSTQIISFLPPPTPFKNLSKTNQQWLVPSRRLASRRVARPPASSSPPRLPASPPRPPVSFWRLPCEATTRFSLRAVFLPRAASPYFPAEPARRPRRVVVCIAFDASVERKERKIENGSRASVSLLAGKTRKSKALSFFFLTSL